LKSTVKSWWNYFIKNFAVTYLFCFWFYINIFVKIIKTRLLSMLLSMHCNSHNHATSNTIIWEKYKHKFCHILCVIDTCCKRVESCKKSQKFTQDMIKCSHAMLGWTILSITSLLTDRQSVRNSFCYPKIWESSNTTHDNENY